MTSNAGLGTPGFRRTYNPGMTDTRDWRAINDRLVATLKPFAEPLAISFHGPGEPPPAARVEPRYPAPNEHGRTGQVPAG